MNRGRGRTLRREAGFGDTVRMTDEEFAALPVFAALPDYLDLPRRGRDALARLVGARIVRIGGTAPRLIDGGGLVIDYVRNAAEAPERVVFAFNERAMWVAYQAEDQPAEQRPSS